MRRTLALIACCATIAGCGAAAGSSKSAAAQTGGGISGASAASVIASAGHARARLSSGGSLVLGRAGGRWLITGMRPPPHPTEAEDARC